MKCVLRYFKSTQKAAQSTEWCCDIERSYIHEKQAKQNRYVSVLTELTPLINSKHNPIKLTFNPPRYVRLQPELKC